MNKKTLLSSILFVVLVFIDQLLKYNLCSTALGPTCHVNSGLHLGLFAGIDPFFKKSIITATAGLLLMAVVYAKILLSEELTVFKFGLAFISTGFISNSIDRLLFEGVRDPLSVIANYYFNFADAIMLLGVLLVLYGQKFFWSHACLRRRLILYEEQKKFIGKLVIISLVTCVPCAFLSIGYLSYRQVESALLVQYALTFLFFTVLSMVITFIFALQISNKIYGPLYSFEMNIRGQQEQDFRLRKGDLIKQLEVIAGHIKLGDKEDEERA